MENNTNTTTREPSWDAVGEPRPESSLGCPASLDALLESLSVSEPENNEVSVGTPTPAEGLQAMLSMSGFASPPLSKSTHERVDSFLEPLPPARCDSPPPPPPRIPEAYTQLQDLSAALYKALKDLTKGYRTSIARARTTQKRAAIRKKFDKKTATLLHNFEQKVQGTLWEGMGPRMLSDLTLSAYPSQSSTRHAPNSLYTLRRSLIKELDSHLYARATAQRALEQDRLAWGDEMIAQLMQLEEDTKRAELLFADRFLELWDFQWIATEQEFQAEYEAFCGDMERLAPMGERLSVELERLGECMDDDDGEEDEGNRGGEGIEGEPWWFREEKVCRGE